MSNSRIIVCLMALTACFMLAPAARAQREIHHIPPWINADGANPDLVQPFIEPLSFHPDFQFFAPAEFGEFGNGPRPNTGWFADYDRVYIYVTRPEAEASLTEGDFTWGNRVDVGYMTEEDHGWLVSAWHIDGPNNHFITLVERINVLEPDDELTFDPNNDVILRGGGTTGGGGQQQQQQQRRPGFPRADRNDPVTGERQYRLHNSVNVADLSSIELNKSFRLRTLHYGSVIEPFFGFRYMKFQDFHRRDSYVRYNEETGLPLIGPFPIPPTDIEDFTIEELTSVRSNFDNHLVGGQVGLRWFKQKSRWLLSGEVRAFAFENFQSFDAVTAVDRTFYEDVGIDEDVLTILTERATGSGHGSEFVFGGEVRAEAAYEVTRDISARVGVAWMELARGIGRGNNPSRNDEDVTMFGVTFGLTLNR